MYALMSSLHDTSRSYIYIILKSLIHYMATIVGSDHSTDSSVCIYTAIRACFLSAKMTLYTRRYFEGRVGVCIMFFCCCCCCTHTAIDCILTYLVAFFPVSRLSWNSEIISYAYAQRSVMIYLFHRAFECLYVKFCRNSSSNRDRLDVRGILSKDDRWGKETSGEADNSQEVYIFT